MPVGRRAPINATQRACSHHETLILLTLSTITGDVEVRECAPIRRRYCLSDASERAVAD